MTSLFKCFHPCCRGKPTIRQSRSVYLVSTNQHGSPYQNCVNSLLSHLDYQPHSVCSILEYVNKATVGVGLIKWSAAVVLNGMQSHCGTLAANTRISSLCDVVSRFLLATRTFCSRSRSTRRDQGCALVVEIRVRSNE